MKIFINDKPLVFTSEKLDEKLDLFKSDVTYQKVMHLFLKEDCNGGIIESANATKLFENFCKQFVIIEAAGGVVYNVEERILLIERLGKWDLPKGKVERVESPKHAAIREVCEETGVCDLNITEPLQPTYHTYVHKGKTILKRTYWFIMYCNSFSNFILQKEEGITNAQWMSKEEIKVAMQNSYASINDLMQDILKEN